MMKLKIAKSNAVAALTACCAVVDTKSITPHGACVVIDAFMGNVTMMSTTYHQTIERSTVAIEVSSPGRVMVNATDLLKRIDAFPDGEIAIEEVKNGIDIRQGKAKGFTQAKYDISEAPKIAKVEPQGAEIDARAFGLLLGRMVPAMGTDDSRPSQYAIKVDGTGERLIAMATEGHVGAIASLTFDGEIDALIPAPAVHQLRKLLGKIDGTVRLFMVGPHLHIFAPGMVYSTITTGNEPAFPPLKQIMPAREGKSATVGKVAALAAIKFVDLVDLKDNRLHIRAGEGGVMFHGASKDGSPGERVIDGTCDIRCSISSKYLAAMLEFNGDDSITIWQDDGDRRIGGAGGGVICENASGDIFVVMPLGYDADDMID